MENQDLFYEIRWAKKEEWKSTMHMIWETFIKYEGDDYTAEGIRNFYDFITDKKLHQSFLEGAYQMMVAVDQDGNVIGAGSIRNENHLSLLFVAEGFHRKGIGTAIIERLSQYLVEEEGQNCLSVMAAPYAVGFYQAVGFQIVTKEQEFSGIRVTNMEKALI